MCCTRHSGRPLVADCCIAHKPHPPHISQTIIQITLQINVHFSIKFAVRELFDDLKNGMWCHDCELVIGSETAAPAHDSTLNDIISAR